MRIIINHDQCEHGGWFSDSCLAATLRNPLGHEHFCSSQAVENDGQAELTVSLIMYGHRYTLILHDEAEIEAVASEGCEAFLRDGIEEPVTMVSGA